MDRIQFRRRADRRPNRPDAPGQHTRRSQPAILSGHAIQAKNQIVLGAATLAALHKKIGQSVMVSYGSPKDAPIYQPPTHLVIVGTATMPAIGIAGTLTPLWAPGRCSPRPSLSPPSPGRSSMPTPTSMARRSMWYGSEAVSRHRPHSSSLHRIADAANKAVANDPQTYGDSFVVLGVQRPAEIVNYQSTGASPGILAAGLAVGAVVALGLTLGASVRRRRRDIALLKTLGFTTHQLAVAVAWQASVVAIVGIIVGVPAGIALGDGFGTCSPLHLRVPLPTAPVLESSSWRSGHSSWPTWWPPSGTDGARTPTALILRAE